MLNRRFKEANRPPEGSSWCWLTAEMLDSPAWRALAGNAMKVVMRIALEHLKHGGVENGKLPVTYQDFVKCGVRRNSVRQAILIAIYLGWIDKTSTGEVPWHGDIRKPSTFALTWLPRHDGVPPSNRWKRFESDAEAKAATGWPRPSLRKFDAFLLSSIDKENRIPHPKALFGQVTVPILAQVTIQYLAKTSCRKTQVTIPVLLSISRLGPDDRESLILPFLPMRTQPAHLAMRMTMNSQTPT
jgi:hypothetical protein